MMRWWWWCWWWWRWWWWWWWWWWCWCWWWWWWCRVMHVSFIQRSSLSIQSHNMPLLGQRSQSTLQTTTKSFVWFWSSLVGFLLHLHESVFLYDTQTKQMDSYCILKVISNGSLQMKTSFGLRWFCHLLVISSYASGMSDSLLDTFYPNMLTPGESLRLAIILYSSLSGCKLWH